MQLSSELYKKLLDLCAGQQSITLTPVTNVNTGKDMIEVSAAAYPDGLAGYLEIKDGIVVHTPPF